MKASAAPNSTFGRVSEAKTNVQQTARIDTVLHIQHYTLRTCRSQGRMGEISLLS